MLERLIGPDFLLVYDSASAEFSGAILPVVEVRSEDTIKMRVDATGRIIRVSGPWCRLSTDRTKEGLVISSFVISRGPEGEYWIHGTLPKEQSLCAESL